jgi:DNA-binding transcriptional MerR regulator
MMRNIPSKEEELTSYVRHHLERGFTFAEIRKRLLHYKYRSRMVDEAFEKVWRECRDVESLLKRDLRSLRERTQELIGHTHPRQLLSKIPFVRPYSVYHPQHSPFQLGLVGMSGASVLSAAIVAYLVLLSIYKTGGITCYYPGAITGCSLGQTFLFYPLVFLLSAFFFGLLMFIGGLLVGAISNKWYQKRKVIH